MFFFFKWVRILPEIDWYPYQGASPAPSCIVRHKTLIKTPTREVSHQKPVSHIYTNIMRIKDNSDKNKNNSKNKLCLIIKMADVIQEGGPNVSVYTNTIL